MFRVEGVVGAYLIRLRLWRVLVVKYRLQVDNFAFNLGTFGYEHLQGPHQGLCRERFQSVLKSS